MNDRQLLDDYAATGSESAFAELVGRYARPVYAAAVRQVGDPHLGEDVTQAVFLLLARKASRIPPATPVPAWLLRTTRYAANNARRLRAIRRAHERRAAARAPTATDGPPAVDPLGPLLDEAIDRLRPKDRRVVVLRFMQGLTFDEVAAALQISEAAARKRLDRAVQAMRGFFARRGVTVPAAAVVTELTHRLAGLDVAAPLTEPVVNAAAASERASRIAKGANTMMIVSRLSSAAAVVVTAGVVGAMAVAIVPSRPARAAGDAAPAAAAKPARAAAATPKQAITELAAAIRNGDVEQVRAGIQWSTPAERAVVDVQARTCASHAELRRAILDKFGRAELDKFPQLVGPTSIPPDAVETVTGDTATVQFGPASMPMVRVDGQWKLAYAALGAAALPLPPEQLAQWFEHVNQALDDVAEEVRDGQLKTPADAMTALRQQMVSVSKKMQAAATTPAPPATQPVK